jgi:hypothetical protein
MSAKTDSVAGGMISGMFVEQEQPMVVCINGP